MTSGGLWKVPAAVLGHAEVYEEDGGAPAPATATWQTQPFQVSIPRPAPSLRLVEDVTHSVQKTSKVWWMSSICFFLVSSNKYLVQVFRSSPFIWEVYAWGVKAHQEQVCASPGCLLLVLPEVPEQAPHPNPALSLLSLRSRSRSLNWQQQKLHREYFLLLSSLRLQ